ncbi:neutral zinc metallopeptidase [Streptosporangium sp. NBC_01756]|uniref:neutral zinc metallopeptidase n=1 Tax=Streptosporangium sp. NBC_01756 TaxID=2975950 RepID=UPI002DD80690|nr:neutral zinc metallopeptidase [Streptosporangium sp. NBC_01756]WSC87343.1 neutral zinc metallopeptidase [Streptosporangium sp. NBC_01756]
MEYAEGDAWVYQIIAHEWAHAVQNRVPGRYVSVKVELQADCLAGATLVGAARDGTLTWERSDSQEIAAALSYRAGDTPWTNPLDHGTARQRIDAFAKGARGGAPACFPGRF